MEYGSGGEIMKQEELVSIVCVTYNHVSYIRCALDGFLMQKTTFPVKILVYDDASDDGTAEIVREYEERYPERIEAILSKENMYSKVDNFPVNLPNMIKHYINGKYIALCEGDDYWTDADKLQLQIDYMETHPECCLTAHASKQINCRNNEEHGFHPYTESRYLSGDEVILQKNGNLSTASLVMRREVYFRGSDYPISDVGDVSIQLHAIMLGKVYYFDREMSVYRFMHSNSWSSRVSGQALLSAKHRMHMLSFLEEYDVYSSHRYHESIRKRKIFYYDVLCDCFGKLTEAQREELQILADKVDLNEVVRVSGNKNGEINLSEEEKQALSGHKFVVIYGCGNNAPIIEAMLDKLKISYEGYVISDNQSEIPEGINGKPVWHLSQYPKAYDKTIIVVSAGQKYEEEIRKCLSKYRGFGLITPLWYNDL